MTKNSLKIPKYLIDEDRNVYQLHKKSGWTSIGLVLYYQKLGNIRELDDIDLSEKMKI